MAQRRAFPAKTICPTNKGALPRERLFARLDRAATCPIVWIAGPAGSGKTTLVSSYVEDRRLRCLWVQLDAGDEDLASFFYYAGLASAKAAPRRKRLPLLTPEYLPGLPAFIRNFFEELSKRLGNNSVLVLDNCHEVSPSAPLHGALLEGMTRLTGGVRLILVSRGDPPPAYARLRAHGEMEVIDREALRLTPEEFEGIAGLRGVDGSKDELRRLHGLSLGWAAGLQILLEVSRTQSVPLRDLGSRVPEEIFDYFGGVIFAGLDAERQSFLLQTSFLPSMTSSLAGELTGYPGAARILSALHREGHFTEKRSHVDPAYQYHPLFREFLQRRAREAMAAGELEDVQRRAGALLAGAGRPEDAAALLAGVGDWPGLAELAATQAPILLAQGRNETLEGWLRALPEEVLTNAPWLLYWLGAARFLYDPGEAQGFFERAFAGFREQGDGGPGLLLSWAGVVTAISLAFSDFGAADPWLELLPSLVGSPSNLPPGEVSARVAAAVLAVMSHHAPSHPDLPAWEQRALELEPSSDDLACRVDILCNAAWLNAMRGRRTVSQGLLERLRAVGKSGQVSPLAEVLALASEGLICWYYDNLDRSISAFHRCLDVGETTGVRFLEPFSLSYLGFIELIEGNEAAVRECVARAKALLPVVRPFDKVACLFLIVSIHIVDGNLGLAREAAQEALRLCQSAGAVGAAPYGNLLLAEVLCSLGNRREGFRHLTSTIRAAAQNQTRQLTFSALLQAARMHLDAGRKDRARAALRQGIEVGRGIEALRAFGFYGAPLAALCAEALEAKIEVDYVRSLIRHNRLAPPAGREAPDAWPWPMRIHTFGGFEVHLDGEPLNVGRKAPRKPLDLLKALIAFGGRGVSEGRLSDALWPDSDGAAAQKAFETALYRLRKLLGVREALLVHEGRLTLDDRYCWVDAHAFERLLKDSEGAPESLASTEEALDLYNGSFLSGEDGAWAIVPRERLRNRYLRAVASVGPAREAGGAGGVEAAIDWYRKGLEVDPLAEELYQGLIRCHGRLGRKAEALAAFRRCRQVLAKVLGVEPSAATLALAEAARD